MNLYEKYKDRVNFVVVDIDQHRSKDQQKLVQRFYRGSIPHLTILGKKGEVLYDRAGETSDDMVTFSKGSEILSVSTQALEAKKGAAVFVNRTEGGPR